MRKNGIEVYSHLAFTRDIIPQLVIISIFFLLPLFCYFLSLYENYFFIFWAMTFDLHVFFFIWKLFFGLRLNFLKKITNLGWNFLNIFLTFLPYIPIELRPFFNNFFCTLSFGDNNWCLDYFFVFFVWTKFKVWVTKI